MKVINRNKKVSFGGQAVSEIHVEKAFFYGLNRKKNGARLDSF
jgi:hypothetical protein